MKRSLQLDAVRGIAIILAAGWHLNYFTGNKIFDIFMFPGRLIGWSGVDLFFVLSGFLVGRLILEELRDTGSFSYGKFLIRRAFRLWPVLYFYVIVEILMGTKNWTEFAPQIFLHVQNYFVTPLYQLWSLAVEEQFYLISGLFLPVMAYKKARPSTYLIVLLCIMASCLVLRLIAVQMGVQRMALQYQLQFRADALACGVALAVLRVHYPNIFNALSKRKIVLFCISVVGFASQVPFGMGEIHSTIGFTVTYLSSACLILSAYEWKYPKYAEPALKITGFLGLYSYSIYIWHVAFGHTAQAILRKVHINNDILIVIAGYVGAIGGAYVVARLIEMPMIKLRDRLFPRIRHEGVQIGGEDLPTAVEVSGT
ncbi:acyltransferase family protein [Sphingomonas oryzagri]